MRLLLRPLIAALRPAFLRLEERGAAPAAGACLDDDGLAAAADGHATPSMRAHLAGCPACRTTLADLVTLLGAPAVSRERERLAPSRSRWSRRGPLAVAAAAALALVVVGDGLLVTRDTERLRDHPGSIREVVPALIAPRAEVAGRAVFRWSAVPDATEYRLTVFDTEGGLVWSAETSDTSLALDDDVVLNLGQDYWWRVEARVDFDRWVSSALADFEPR